MTRELYRARRDELVEALERVDAGELVRVWNETIAKDNPDEMVYSMDEFDELLRYECPSRIANMVQYGEFNGNDDWFMFNGYGNLKSAWRAVDLMTLEDLADYMLEKWDACGLDDVTDLLAEWETVDELQPA